MCSIRAVLSISQFTIFFFLIPLSSSVTSLSVRLQSLLFLCKWLFFLPLIVISMWRIVARTLSTSHTIVHWLFTAQLSHKHTTENFVFQIILIFSHCISSKLFFSFVLKLVQILWHSVLLTITPKVNMNIFLLLISRKRKNDNINNNNNGSKPNILMHFKHEFFDWSFWIIL